VKCISYSELSERRSTLLPLTFSFILVYAIRKVREKWKGLELNGTHQLPVYADVNLLGKSISTNGKHKL
jgi:hypothetical protein